MGSRRLRARSVIAALAAVVVTALGGAVVAPATAADPGGITGTVTGPDGELLAGVWVDATVLAPYAEVGGWTDADGVYTLGGLAPGTYTVALEDYPRGDYAPTSFEVVVADTVVTADVELELAGHIAGTVTDGAGEGIPGISAVAYQWDTTTDTMMPVGGYGATTDADGDYQIDGLPAGTFRVRFTDVSGELISESWNDAAQIEDGADIAVTAGEVSDSIDAVLEPGHHIIGTITGGGTGVGGIMVAAYVDDASFTSAGFAYTDSDGTYDLGGLPPGDYRLCFADPASAWVSECFDDVPTLADATVVPVPGDAPPQADAELTAATHIAGVVTGPANGAAIGVQVAAYRESGDGTWEFVGSALTDSSGAYDLVGLPAGVYRVAFAPFGEPDYVGEYWDGASSLDAADDIDLSDGTPATGIDAQLAAGGHVTGTVTGPDGAPLAGIYVNAVRRPAAPGSPTGFAVTDADGRYDIGGLGTGDYDVSFNDLAQSYVPEFWPDAHPPAGGEAVPVTAGATTSQIDARLEQAGRISGTVTGTDAGPVGDVGVIAHRLDQTSRTWAPTAGAMTQPDGSYDVGGLLPGTYRVQFRDLSGAGYADEFWNDAPTLARGRDIEVIAGDTQRGVDARLALPIVQPPAISNLAPPTIAGDAVVGRPLTADPGRWSPDDGLTYTYRWLADGITLPGAEGSTYVPTAADLGKRIRVRVTVTRAEFSTSSTTSASTRAVVEPSVTFETAPRITAAPHVGTPVGSSRGTWSPATGRAGYQWLVDDAPVAGATGATYKPRPADVGRSLRLQVTVTAPGREPAVATSVAARIRPGAISTQRSPRLVGATRPGAVLRVQGGRWQPSTVALTYRWYAGGTRLVGTTGPRLDLTQALVRKHAGTRIRVVVTLRAPGYRADSLRLRSSRLRIPQADPGAGRGSVAIPKTSSTSPSTSTAYPAGSELTR